MIVSSDRDLVESESFDSQFTTYESSFCMNVNLCHVFKIIDAYGDGLLGDGKFNVTIDDEELVSVKKVGFSTLELNFGDGC